jgi:hypothetical protein
MPDREDKLRQRAAECLVLSRKATNHEVRVGLVTMAQKLYEIADSEPRRMDYLDQAVRAFDDDRMGTQ